MTNQQNAFHIPSDFLPKKLEKVYVPETILKISTHSTIMMLSSKETSQPFILKIIEKKYYHKRLAKVLCHLRKSALLLPIQIETDTSYVYFIYPPLKTLSDVLLQEGLSYSKLRRLVTEIGEAITTLHKHNILHLDIAPDNLFFDEHGHAYLGDFSSSRFAKDSLFSCLSKNCLRTGTTLSFAPTEQQLPKKVPSFWDDQYSFALLLYYLLNNGSAPLQEDNPPFSFFPSVNGILQKAMKSPSRASKETFSDFLLELENAFLKDQKLLTNQEFLIPFDALQQNFCNTDTPDCTIQEETASPKKNIIPVPFYGLLIFCGFLFLFSLYHYFAQSKREYTTMEAVQLPYKKEVSGNTVFSEASASPIVTEKATNFCQNNILDISHSGQKDASFLKASQTCSSVKILFAGFCKFENDTPFSSMNQLEELYLNDNPLNSVNALSHMPRLKTLVLSKCRLTDISCLSKIDSLTILDISHNNHLKEIRSLASLEHLSYLIVTNTNITQKEIRFLQKKLPHCTILF